MKTFPRVLVPLRASDFKDYEINGVKVRIILEEYHQRFTRKCFHACSSSRMNLPSVDMINSKELANLLLSSIPAKIVSYPTSIELDVTSNKVTVLLVVWKNKTRGHLQWLDVNTGHSVANINWLQFADKMPFSPNDLDTIIMVESGLVGKSSFVGDFINERNVMQIPISSNTCEDLKKPVFSCFHDPTLRKAHLIDVRINEIKKRECSLRVFCKNKDNETYKRKYRTRFH